MGWSWNYVVDSSQTKLSRSQLRNYSIKPYPSSVTRVEPFSAVPSPLL